VVAVVELLTAMVLPVVLAVAVDVKQVESKLVVLEYRVKVLLVVIHYLQVFYLPVAAVELVQ
jgi:hypothetical protein